MTFSLGIETKIATIPNAIRPSSAQKSVRPQEEKSLRVSAGSGDERRRGAGRLPQSGRVRVGVVGDDGCHRQAEQEAKSEQESDRELLAALGRGDVEAEDAGERADEQQQPGRATEISAEVRAERGEPDRDGDEAHDVAEKCPGLVARDWLCRESRLAGDGLERAHVTTTTGTGRRPRRAGGAIPAPSTILS